MCLVETRFVARLRLNVFSRHLFCRYRPVFNREVLVRCYFGPLFRLGFPKLRCARLVPRLVKSIRSVSFWAHVLRCARLVPRLVKSSRSVLF